MNVSLKPDPANPWIVEAIVSLRKRHSDEQLRADYLAYSGKNPDEEWHDYLAERALYEEVQRNPFLATPLSEMFLPKELKLALQQNMVDIVADVMQITAEEMKTLLEYDHSAKTVTTYLRQISTYLNINGLNLYHSRCNTLKWAYVKDMF